MPNRTTTTTQNRRDGIVSPWDLASSYAPPAERLAPISRDLEELEAVHGDDNGDKAGGPGRKARAKILAPLEANVNHRKLEGTASREKREKAEERLQRQAPPVDPPADFNMARRRGGLGTNAITTGGWCVSA